MSKRVIHVLNRAAHESFIIAGAAAGIAYTVQLILGYFTFIPLLTGIIFAMMFSVYRINKVMDLDEDALTHPERAKFFTSKKKSKTELFILPVIIYLAVFVAAFFVNLSFFAIMVFSLFWIVFYSIPLPTFIAKFFGEKKIKQIPFAKTAYSSLAWALIVLMTVTFLGHPFTLAVWILFIYVFLRFTINTVCFDLRDVGGDATIGNKTIPVLFGAKKTLNFLHLLNFLSTGLIIAAVYFGILPAYSLGLVLAFIYAYVYLILINIKKIDVHALCDIIIDGEFILWIIFILAGKLLLI